MASIGPHYVKSLTAAGQRPDVSFPLIEAETEREAIAKIIEFLDGLSVLNGFPTLILASTPEIIPDQTKTFDDFEVSVHRGRSYALRGGKDLGFDLFREGDHAVPLQARKQRARLFRFVQLSEHREHISADLESFSCA